MMKMPQMDKISTAVRKRWSATLESYLWKTSITICQLELVTPNSGIIAPVLPLKIARNVVILLAAALFAGQLTATADKVETEG
jgi:hypothetical protein